MRDLRSLSETRRYPLPRKTTPLVTACVASGRGSFVDISAALGLGPARSIDGRNDAVSLAPLLLTSIDHELDENVHIDQVGANLTRLVCQFIVPLPMMRTRPSCA